MPWRGVKLDPRIGLPVMGLVITIVAVRGIRQYRRARPTERWDRIKAQITWSVVAEVERLGKSGYRTDYVPQIRFRYSVGRKEYESDRILRHPVATTTERSARELIRKYPTGKVVDAYVNPLKLDDAVLIKGDPGAIDRFIVIGLFVLVLAVMVWAATLS